MRKALLSLRISSHAIVLVLIAMGLSGPSRAMEAPVAAPVEAPVESTGEAPAELPVEAPVESSVEAPAEAPVEAPAELPAEAASTPPENAAAPAEEAGQEPATVPPVATEPSTQVPADDAPAPPPAAAPAPADAPEEVAADFSANDALINLGPSLAATRVSDPARPGAAWFTIYVANESENLVSRVLVAVDPLDAGVTLFPPAGRPMLLEVAASDTAAIVERAAAYGSNAFRIILPPSQQTALALHFDNVASEPTLLAWTESALIAHNRQISLLVGSIGGLFTAALAFAAAAAALSGRVFTRWAAFLLAALSFAYLTAAHAFDDVWITSFGGPYGLFAFMLAAAIAAGIRLIDHVAAYEAFWPAGRILGDAAAVVLVLLGFAALLGLPGAGLAVRVLTVVAAAAAAGYLTHCGRLGVAGARRLAPAAAIFALVTAVASFRALGLVGTGVMAPTIIAGFAAVGAVLLALTGVVASTEPTVARLRAMRRAHSHDDVQATTTDEAIAESREHAAVVASHQGIFDLDLDAGLLSLSAEAAQIIGLGSAPLEIPHDDWLRRLHPEDRDVYLEALAIYRDRPDIAFRVEFRARKKDGELAWFELRATMIGQATEPERCLGLIANVTARKETEFQAPQQQIDVLTGLGNRLALFELLDSSQDQFAKLTLIVLDIDRFKAVNASVGADDADALLRDVALRLGERFQKRAKVFRVAGDMFAVTIPKPAKPSTAGNAVLQCMAAPFIVSEREIYLPVSVGVASGETARDAQDFFAKAELAMVQAKREGGAQACEYADTLLQPAPESNGDPVELDTGLRRAIERGEIEIHYQPIMRVSNGSIAGFEALLRWNHPEHGVIEPDEFVPYAERTGLVLPLGRLALESAAEDLGRWQHFFPLDPPLFVSVNVSWRQIEAKDFPNEVRAVLHRAKLAEHTLRLEVTERAVVSATKTAENALKRLRALGAGLAIDDFGTGHSSLSHLKRFQFDVVKIDKSFVVAGKKEETILASIVKLAHELGLQVVAEGVETEDDVRRLRELECEYAQGFLFGQPLPAQEIPNFIAMTYAREE